VKRRISLLFLLAFFNSVINAGEYNILDFGAVRNKLSTSAIQKAVDYCNSNGGRTVIVPEGIFITGTIILKSNVNFFLSPGSELRSSLNRSFLMLILYDLNSQYGFSSEY
jgi:polygalacturonase